MADVNGRLAAEYSNRLFRIGKLLQGCVENIGRDPILLQMARDSASAVHISVRVADILNNVLGREQEVTTKKALQRAVAAEADLEATRDALRNLKAETTHLRGTLTTEVRQIADHGKLRDLEQTIDNLKKENNRLQRNADDTHAHQNTLLTTAHADKSALGDEVSELRMQNQWLKDERMRTGNKYSRIASQVKDTLDGKLLECDDLRLRMRQLADTNTALTTEKQKVAAKHEGISEKLTDARQQLADKERVIVKLQRQLRTVTEENRSYERDVRMLKMQFDNIKTTVGEKERQLHEYTLKETLDAKLKSFLDATNQQADRSKAQASAVDQNTQVYEMRVEQLNTALQTSRTVITSLERKNDALAEQLQAVTDQAQRDLVELTAQLRQAVDARGGMEREVGALRLKLAESENEGDLREAKYASAINTHKLKEEADKLRHQLTAKDERVTEVEREGMAAEARGLR